MPHQPLVDTPAPHGAFWQHPFVAKVLPFLTSLVLHVSLILIGYLTFQAATQIIGGRARDDDAAQEPVTKIQITPTVSDMTPLVDAPRVSLQRFPGLGDDLARPARQEKFPNVAPDSTGIAQRPGRNLIPQLRGDGGDSEQSGIIGIGGRNGLVPDGRVSIGDGGDGDDGGKLAPFGPASRGPRADFLKIQDVASRICYVCDASGSMMSMFDDLRAQIAISLARLKPTQSFDVIFFQKEGCSALDKTQLLPATPASTRRAEKFLGDTFAHGGTDPIPALELAASLKPELIYLLTDGDFEGPGNEKVIEYCKRKFADGTTKINTIAFIGDKNADAQELEFVRALRAIARNSGGEFRRVSDEDISAR